MYLNHVNRKGEELAASGFVAIICYLFVDINIGISRVFKRKQGLYYWCMLLGTWGCLTNAIAVILKFLMPNSEPLWPLYTLFILAGWTIYAPAQLLVLYSRLHLISQDRSVQRLVLTMIVSVALVAIIPTWVFAWPAYNPYNAHLSSLYSPREAILDRCTQLAFSIVEIIISGIYIASSAKLLRLKAGVRQQRVMTDLIYIMVIAVLLDVVTIVHVFLNQVGISHPVQTFSYILKLKLEFMALNQLMAVAARGVQKESFAERRYHYPSVQSDSSPSPKSSKAYGLRLLSAQDQLEEGSYKELPVPPPPISSSSTHASIGSPSSATRDSVKPRMWSAWMQARKGDSNGRQSDTEDDDICVHLWERRGKLIMEAPWFSLDSKI